METEIPHCHLLRGPPAASEARIATPTECALGIWLERRADQIPFHSGLSLLIQLHDRIHETARAVIMFSKLDNSRLSLATMIRFDELWRMLEDALRGFEDNGDSYPKK